MFNSTVLKEQQASSNLVESLYTSLFQFTLHGTGEGKKLRETFYERFSPSTLGSDLLQGLERLDRFLITYLLLENGNVGNYYKKLLIEGDVVKTLINKKKQYKNNMLLQQLVPMLPEETRPTYNVKLFNKRYSKYEQENLINGFKELMNKEPEFAKKLIMQQLLQSGVSLSQNSYQNILPEEYLNLSKKVLETPSFISNEVLAKFIKTHWKANELFKSKYIESAKGSDSITLKGIRNGVNFIRVRNRNKESFFYRYTGYTAEGGGKIFNLLEPLGNYPWAINIKEVKETPKVVLPSPVKKSTAKTAEEDYSTTDTVDLTTTPNSLKDKWNKFTMEEMKHLESKNISNFGQFSTAVGEFEATGITEDQAIEILLKC